MLRDHLSALVLAIAIITGAIILRPAPATPSFEVIGLDGVLYRLNQKTGRIDVLVPAAEGALMMPVGQVSSPVTDNMSEAEKKQLSGFLKAIALYIRSERDKSLGLKFETPADSTASAK